MKEVAETLNELAGVFERFGLPYAVIGGIAVRAYAIPRPTFDVDFTVAVPRARLPEVFAAVEEEGYTAAVEEEGYTVPQSYQSGWVDSVAGMPLVKFRFFVKERGVDADIFLAETDFQKEIVKRRKMVETPDGNVWLATPEDVVLLKVIANRGRDLSDVNDILFTQGQLDDDYMRKWAVELGVEERLRDIMTQYHEEYSGDDQ